MLEGDTGEVRDVERLARLAADRFGGIDIWVNNARRLMVRPLLETSDEDWHGLLAANLHGYFYGCRAAGRAMVAQGPAGASSTSRAPPTSSWSPTSARTSPPRARSWR
jgi:NAD(P)-dependent dehydrogenase (short-subunit alcohol dehydrogenase family)